jgi:hypothetical protein
MVKSVAPPRTHVGGTTLTWGEVGGGPNSDDWTDTLVLYIVVYFRLNQTFSQKRPAKLNLPVLPLRRGKKATHRHPGLTFQPPKESKYAKMII